MPARKADTMVIPEGELLRPNDWSQPFAWVLGLAAIGIGSLLLLASPAPGSNLDGALRPVLGLAWIAFGVLPLSGARAGVIVERDRIVVRSRMQTSSSYNWSEINQFRLDPSFRGSCLQIDLKDGRRIVARGFGARTETDRRQAESMVAELNRRV